MWKFKNLIGFSHPLEISIVIYLVVVAIIWQIKPRFLFDEEGKFKRFGIGRHRKTTFPMWLFLALVGVIIYFIIANVSARESRTYYCNKIIGSPEEYKKVIINKCNL